MKIFVTHLHGDHFLGILGLLQTMSLQKRTETVEIYGPAGIEEFITANIKVLNFGLPFPVFITILFSFSRKLLSPTGPEVISDHTAYFPEPP